MRTTKRVKVVTPLSVLKSRKRLEEKHAAKVARDTERDRRDATTEFNKLIGKEVSGAKAAFVYLRYLMGGGYPLTLVHGGPALPLVFQMYNNREFRKHVFYVNHEEQGIRFAKGVACSTGKVGVTITTSGPGVGNTFSGCADAYMDRTPLVEITSNVPRALLGSEAFQELDVKGSFRPVAKKVIYVPKASKITSAFFEAFSLAQSGRPGPVVVDIATDAYNQLVKFNPPGDLGSLEARINESRKVSSTATTQLADLAELIKSAKRPVLYIGRGVISAEAWNELRQLVEKTGIPVTYTFTGKGAFPDTDPLCLGPLGTHGREPANYAVDAADLVIGVGVRFDNRVAAIPDKFAPNAYIAQLDIDPRGIGPQKRQPNMVVQGDAKALLNVLNGLVGARPDLSQWYEQIKRWNDTLSLSYVQADDGPIKPQFVMETLNDLLRGEDVIFAFDVGDNLVWGMHYLQTSNPRGSIVSGGFGVMGVAIPTALGAWACNRDRRVVGVFGDGDFEMNPALLGLYLAMQPNITLICVDNYSPDVAPGLMVDNVLQQKYIKPEQRGHKPTNVGIYDIAKITNGFGVDAHDVKHAWEVRPELEAALVHQGPLLLDFKVDPYERFNPVVPQRG